MCAGYEMNMRAGCAIMYWILEITTPLPTTKSTFEIIMNSQQIYYTPVQSTKSTCNYTRHGMSHLLRLHDSFQMIFCYKLFNFRYSSNSIETTTTTTVPKKYGSERKKEIEEQITRHSQAITNGAIH